MVLSTRFVDELDGNIIPLGLFDCPICRVPIQGRCQYCGSFPNIATKTRLIILREEEGNTLKTMNQTRRYDMIRYIRPV